MFDFVIWGWGWKGGRWGVFKFQRSSEPKLTRSACIAKAQAGSAMASVTLTSGFFQASPRDFQSCTTALGQEKTNKHKHFGRDGPWDKRDPVPGTNGTRPWDKLGPVPGTNRPFSVYFHSKIAILSRLSLGRVGVRPWDDCPGRAVRKMLCVFCLLVFFSAPMRKKKRMRLCRPLSSSLTGPSSRTWR